MRKLTLLVFFFFLSPLCHAQIDTPLSVNAKDSPMRGVLELIAAKSGLELIIDHEPAGNVSLNQAKTTGRALLDKLTTEQHIEYTITGNRLIITKKNTVAVTTAGNSHLIRLRYALATEMVSKVTQVIDKEDRVIADDHANALIFIGSKAGLERAQNLISLFDSTPKQIMIEAVIVATSHSFLQDIGVALGDTSDRAQTNNSTVSGYSASSGPKTPNGSFKAILGHIDGRALDIRLTAAESKGLAKVVSRPKVVTLNNRAAKIQSGVTYSIKTLSNVSSSTAATNASSNQGVVTGSIASIDAALTLNILPLLVGEDQIQMIVDINDASPDLGAAIDGIPGISKNQASTAVIVRNKQTAVIAGLVKQTNAKTSTGVPFFSDIPIIGNLFKGKSVIDQNNELVIFLTPTIDDMGGVTIDPELLKPRLLEPKPYVDVDEVKPVEKTESTDRVPATETPAVTSLPTEKSKQ